MSGPRTLYEKIWDDHVVESRPDGTSLVYIDRHIIHEVTTPQAFEGLRAAGRRVRRPDLAATLARFGAEGKRAIYEGPTAWKIASAVTSAGGTMTVQDLAEYQVKERTPLTRTYDGRTIYTMPAPSAGGLMLLEVLGMYGASSSSPLAQMGHGSSADPSGCNDVAGQAQSAPLQPRQHSI